MKSFFSHRILRIVFLLWGMSTVLSWCHASNIQLSSVAIKEKDTLAGTAFISFSLSWDFSWKDRVHRNWDAAWVFVKYYDPVAYVWKHVYMAEPEGIPRQVASGNFVAAPHSMGKSNVPLWSEFATSVTDYGEKVTGVFIYRKDVGNGPVLVEDVLLKWNYVEQGLRASEALQVQVFAIEMVYVPKGEYIIGDGYSPQSLYMDGSDLIIKTNVSGAQASHMGKVKGESNITYQGTAVPDIFPKGYEDFYIMKYEISQHAYADFLNTLDMVQQTTRTSSAPTAGRNTFAMVPSKYASNAIQYRNCIRIWNPGLPAQGGFPATPAVYGLSISGGNSESQWAMEENGGNIACNFLSWSDGLAYLDWSCLRPMTEMEYEKACRGAKFVRAEMAWGEKYGISANEKGLKNQFAPDEMAVDETSCYLETGKAPWVMRVGGFAKDSTRRNQSGATYYGVMNMSDNLWERCVNVSTAEGRSFVPQEGDGQLDANGDAGVFKDIYTDESCWPTDAGAGFRGFQVSNRTYANSQRVVSGEDFRNPWSGFRGVRKAPEASKFDL